ncbi:DNA replication and repair protein recF [Acidithiobacillus ferrivorans SS3]|uniref:DNA replication and repair protein RecF n=1 Tax=Acidithiobacillus ferrivorans SS3 TaxID=743299 RepID=G0JPL1_9PROT|nr:DNA replication and repair protein RecF [Acidithiobacillus ferrivorans]AEM46246.1 DNA replication and repair protein recF [Acidithiobacillus ferrivorans SS3]
MPLEALHIQSVRCIETLDLKADQQWNWLIGANGAGKSSVLEAIHILGTGQSWRRNPRHVQREDDNEYLVSAHLPDHFLALRRRGETREIRYDGESLGSAWMLLDILPLQSLHDDNSHFVAGTAEDRRRVLDWGIYYADHYYGTVFRQYRRALQQRNAWLKSGYGQQPWDDGVIAAGEEIQQRRQAHLATVQPEVATLWERWPGSLSGLSLHLHSGWKEGLALSDCLLRDQEQDREMGYTHSGPHRANLAFRVRGKAALDILSRGQLRVLGLAYRLAQVKILKQAGLPLPTILIDDFAAELDASARDWWVKELDLLGVQVFAAVTAAGQIPAAVSRGGHFCLAAGQLEKETAS